jgi:hypothetical protein
MGNTCRILSNDEVFNALNEVLDQNISLTLRVKFETAQRQGVYNKFSEFLFDNYKKFNTTKHYQRVFTNLNDARLFYDNVKKVYPLVKLPERIPTNGYYKVYVHSGKKFKDIFDSLNDKVKKIIDEESRLEDLKMRKEFEQLQKEANYRVNDEGNIIIYEDAKPYSDYDYLIDTESQYKFVLDRKTEELSNVNKKIAEARSKKNTAEVERLLKVKAGIEESINKLNQGPNFTDILNIADNDLKLIDDIFNKDNVSPQDLVFIMNKFDFWLSKRFEEAFFDNDDIINGSPDYLTFLEKKNEFDRRRTKWNNLAERYMNSVIKDVTGNTYTDEQLKTMKGQLYESNLLESLLRGMSTDKNIFIQIVDYKMKEANELARQEILDFQKLLKEETEKLVKKVGSSDPKKLYKLFIQLDAKGNPTGNIVNRFSQKYFDEIKKYKVIDWSDKDTVARRYKWLKENTITFDPRKLFFEDYLQMEEGNRPIRFTQEQIQEHIAELKKQLGEKGYEYYYKKAKEGFERYKERAEEFKDGLEGTEEEINEAFNEWKKEWSPFYYLDKTTGASYSAGKFLGIENIVSVPRKFKRDGTETGWHDKNFEKIEADDVYLNYYNFFMDAIFKFRKYYPSADDLQVNYLPELRENQLIKQFFTNPLALKSNLYDFFIDQTTENEIFQNQIDSMGNLKRTLPTYMMSNTMSKLSNIEKQIIADQAAKKFPNRNSIEFRNLNEKMQYDAIQEKLKEKSFDLFKVLSAHAATAEAFKHKSRVEDFLRIAKDFVYNAEKIHETNDNKAKKGLFGFLTEKGGLKNLIETFDYASDYFYGINKVKKPGKLVAKDLESKKLIGEYEKEITELKTQPQSEETVKKIELIQEKIKALQTNFVVANAADTILKYIHIKAMGWNPFSAVTNLGFGVISNYTHAAGEEDFGDKELNKAYKLLLNNVLRATHIVNMKTAIKISQLMMEYGVVGDIRDGTGSHNVKSLKEKFKILLPYEMTSRAEFINQGSTFIAMMLRKKITDINGKERNLFEAYTLDDKNNLVWNEKEFGEQPEWQSLGKNKTNFKLKVEAVKEIIHGNYNPNSPVRIKKTAIGRALLMFRNWMAEGFANRFQSERESVILERTIKGRYRSFYQAKSKEGEPVSIGRSLQLTLQEMARLVTKGLYNSKGVNMLSDVDKANLKKNARELNIYMSIMVLSLMLKYMRDDDEEDNMFLTVLINNFNRLQNDIDTYVNPLTFEQLNRNTIPAFGFITDVTRLFNTSYKYLNGEDGKNGSTTFQEAFFRVFPGGFAYYRTQSIIEDVQY